MSTWGAHRARVNVGHKAMTIVHSVLAGGDCIEDTAGLRAGGTEAILGRLLRAPSTVGTFLRSFTFGHARQLDQVSRELLHRAWTAGAGPGAESVTLDLDSSAPRGADRPSGLETRPWRLQWSGE